MTSVVLDTSIAITWCFENEATEQTDRLFDDVCDHGAVVPSLFYLELGNFLLIAEKRGRMTREAVATRLSLIADLPISLDPETAARAWRDVLELARNEKLTTYDAAYLELAIRRNIALLTKDKDLAKAAKRRGVFVSP